MDFVQITSPQFGQLFSDVEIQDFKGSLGIKILYVYTYVYYQMLNTYFSSNNRLTTKCFLLRLSKIKRPQGILIGKFGPTALIFGYDFFLFVPFWGHPVCVGLNMDSG